jgi:type IV secretion system protein VirD4
MTLALLAVLALLVSAAAWAWHRRDRMIAVGLAAATVLPAWVLLSHTHLAVQLLAAAGVPVAAGVVVVHRRTRTSATVTRWGDRTRRTAGVATTFDIVRVSSRFAMYRKAAVVRPSLRGLSRAQRLRTPTRAVAVELCKASGLRIWSPLEDVVTVFGGPRVGKTGWLGGAVLDAPGAVLTTSTRLDLMEVTRPGREAGGRPVWVFNPGGLAELPSTVTFDPLTGCTDPTTATERAADMIPESDGAGDRSYWEGQARRVLAALMHAAALGDLSMRAVLGWVANPDDAAWEVQSLLRRSVEPSYVQDAAQWLTTNDRTRSSITSTMMPALGWLTTKTACDAAHGGGEPFDVQRFLASRGTIYLLGRHEAHTAPLLAALTGYIARESRRLAATQPGGRLDPPLTLALDEAARVAPIPLPDWTGDAGGSGICIIAAFQSRADIVDRYGPTGAAKVLNNSGTVMLYGGTKDPGDLDVWSKLAGDRDEPVITRGKDGKVTSRSVRKTTVLSPAQLANLPAGRVVVFRRGMPPAVGRVAMVWRHRDVRAPARAARPVAAPASPAPASPIPVTHSPAPAWAATTTGEVSHAG